MSEYRECKLYSNAENQFLIHAVPHVVARGPHASHEILHGGERIHIELVSAHLLFQKIQLTYLP
jgi:hypothetical protein